MPASAGATPGVRTGPVRPAGVYLRVVRNRRRGSSWSWLVAALVCASAGAGGEAGAEENLLRPMAIEDQSGHALDGFFASLRRTAAREPGAVTRVAHYGDSLIVGDLITRTLRRLYQDRYGDAGPGFILAGRPWPWYRRQGVLHGATDGWRTYRVLTGGVRDRLFGFGGVTFEAAPRDRRVWYRTADDEGREVRVSRVDVHYLMQPSGGDLDVLVDGEHMVTLGTAGETRRSAFHEVRAPEGPHTIVLRTAGGGPVRLFGVALEREGPGVVYDSLGINGACGTSLARVDAGHMAEQIRHRAPALIVLAFGANESNRPALVDRYQESFVPLLRQLQQASPGASCLVMAPMDRGTDLAAPRPRSNRYVPQIVEAQRRSARAAGCAFFDTYAAMGGDLSIYRWYRRGLASPDLTHPTPEGGALVAQGLFRALEAAYAESSPAR